MKEIPILFSGPMVPPVLADTKTQTRRAIRDQSIGERFSHMTDAGLAHLEWLGTPRCGSGVWDVPEHSADVASPYGQPGDHLWVKETFFAWGRWETRFSAKKGRDEWHFVDMTLEGGHQYAYPADGRTIAPHRRSGGVSPTWWKRPAIFMPRAASRTTLEVTEVRVERLQDISEADAQAEGVYTDPSCPAYDAYAQLWDEINGPGSWEANPWVWAVSFRRITP